MSAPALEVLGLKLSATHLLALSVLVALVIDRLFLSGRKQRRYDADGKEIKEPPMVPYTVPFLGSMITFGMRPLPFLRENLDKVRSTRDARHVRGSCAGMLTPSFALFFCSTATASRSLCLGAR